MKTINKRQITFLTALAILVVIACLIYGVGGALFFTGISAVVLVIFYKALSTESIKAELEYMAGAEDYFGDNDPVYDPMLCSLPQNIYHQD